MEQSERNAIIIAAGIRAAIQTGQDDTGTFRDKFEEAYIEIKKAVEEISKEEEKDERVRVGETERKRIRRFEKSNK